MSLLRDAPAGVPVSALDAAWPDADQLARAVGGLLDDRLVQRDGDLVRLPVGPARAGSEP